MINRYLLLSTTPFVRHLMRPTLNDRSRLREFLSRGGEGSGEIRHRCADPHHPSSTEHTVYMW
jgi:hypothetical protein